MKCGGLAGCRAHSYKARATQPATTRRAHKCGKLGKTKGGKKGGPEAWSLQKRKGGKERRGATAGRDGRNSQQKIRFAATLRLSTDGTCPALPSSPGPPNIHVHPDCATRPPGRAHRPGTSPAARGHLPHSPASPDTPAKRVSHQPLERPENGPSSDGLSPPGSRQIHPQAALRHAHLGCVRLEPT